MPNSRDTFSGRGPDLVWRSNGRRKGDSHHLPERAEGCVAQMVTVTFSAAQGRRFCVANAAIEASERLPARFAPPRGFAVDPGRAGSRNGPGDGDARPVRAGLRRWAALSMRAGAGCRPNPAPVSAATRRSGVRSFSDTSHLGRTFGNATRRSGLPRRVCHFSLAASMGATEASWRATPEQENGDIANIATGGRGG